MECHGDLAGSGVGSARRRRERRLRAALRHEQQTVAMVLSAARHHSAQVGADVLYGALRSQTTDRTAGVRPGVLEEPAPPLVEVRVAGPRTCGAPSLALWQLAGDELVDSSALAFLLSCSLQAQAEEKRRKEEEEQLAKEKEEAEGDVSAACSAVPAAGADALPPRHLGTVFRVHVAGGVIKGDDGRMYPFRSSCMELAVGYRVSFFVRGLAAYGLTRVF